MTQRATRQGKEMSDEKGAEDREMRRVRGEEKVVPVWGGVGGEGGRTNREWLKKKMRRGSRDIQGRKRAKAKGGGAGGDEMRIRREEWDEEGEEEKERRGGEDVSFYLSFFLAYLPSGGGGRSNSRPMRSIDVKMWGAWSEAANRKDEEKNADESQMRKEEEGDGEEREAGAGERQLMGGEGLS